ncbi:hypothetical protein BGX34_000920 [Mortierella sp. NVP85]|nr:hypothetical protein BGX34_000920 [Mortierella sp. NVP85]
MVVLIGKSYLVNVLCKKYSVQYTANLAVMYPGDLLKGLKSYLESIKPHASAVAPRPKTMVLGLTRDARVLDPGVTSLFDDAIELDIPTPEARCVILKACTVNHGMALHHQRQNATRDPSSLEARSILTPTERDPLETISIQCHGYSAADLDTLYRQAAIIANRDGRGMDRLALKEFEEAMQSIKISALRQSTSVQEVDPIRCRRLFYDFYLRDRGHRKNPSFEYTSTPKPMHVWVSVLLKEYYCAYDPPGTGETLLAKAVATESEANLMVVSIPDLIKGETGESEKAISMVFKMVTRCSPCIVFLDELEAIFGLRESSGGLGKQLISQLLMQLDNCGQGVVILAATNHPEAIETSILRSGCLDRLVYVPSPNFEERMVILQVLKQTTRFSEDIDLRTVSNLTNNVTGAELKALVRKAGLQVLEAALRTVLLDGTNACAYSHAPLLQKSSIVPTFSPSRPVHYALWIGIWTSVRETPKRAVTESNKDIMPRVSDEVNTAQEQPLSDNLDQVRKDSANRMLRSILETSPMSATLKRYKPYMVLWQKFCDANYGGDCSVNAARMLNFFNDVVFKKNTPTQTQATADTDAVLEWQLNQTIDTQKLPLHVSQSVQDPEPEEVVEDDDDDNDCEPGVFSKESEGEAEELTTTFITTVQQKVQVIEHDIPVAAETVADIRKALVYLWRHQGSWTAPNPSPSPRKDLPLREAIDEYEVRLVYDNVQPGTALRTITCSVAGQPIPDFSNLDGWYNIKLLTVGTPDERQQHRAQSLASRTQIDTTSSVMRSCEVFSSKNATLSCYPWIEEAFDKDMPNKKEAWIRECDQEMMGVDPNLVTEVIYWTGVETSVTTTATKKLSITLQSSTLVDRISFLKLLVRMRRVILQDAVLYMKPNSRGETLS